jgi:hypothetical protein
MMLLSVSGEEGTIQTCSEQRLLLWIFVFEGDCSQGRRHPLHPFHGFAFRRLTLNSLLPRLGQPGMKLLDWAVHQVNRSIELVMKNATMGPRPCNLM